MRTIHKKNRKGKRATFKGIKHGVKKITKTTTKQFLLPQPTSVGWVFLCVPSGVYWRKIAKVRKRPLRYLCDVNCFFLSRTQKKFLTYEMEWDILGTY